MRLHVLSDLHLELGEGSPGDVAHRRGLAFGVTDADVVILAGDVAAGADAVPWAAATWPDRPVLYVLGNHEFYRRDVATVIAECRDAARGTNVQILERDAVTLDGVRFLGTTLWTDFELWGDVPAAQEAVGGWMMDFFVIRHPDTGTLEPEHTRQWHLAARDWLCGELEAADGPTVVISHHAPHRRSDHFGNIGSAAFVSDLAELMQRHRPRLWIHGHTHGRDDYRCGDTRILSNQGGYADESTGFDPHCVIDVG